MCGIIGYIGPKKALPILMNGLKRLEYRGYDSAGFAIFENGVIKRVRAVGKIDNLASKIIGQESESCCGIAHTRWATHGGVTEANAHPHAACSENLIIAHNGIIENYRELKSKFLSKHNFSSETDSEVLAHLIESHYKGDLRMAIQQALSHVHGTYGLVAMHLSEPNKLVAARCGSPLAIGIGENEFFIASDTSPMLAYTQRVIFLDDGEVAEITRDGVQIFNLKDEKITKHAEQIEWSESEAQTNGFPHFMLKEIFDQPQVFQDALAGRLSFKEGSGHLGGLNLSEDELRRFKSVKIVACGTAFYAGLVGKYILEHLTGLPVDTEVASEFRYRDPVILPNTLAIFVSQSGETADTLAALREAKRKGATIMGIINVVGSTIAREAGRGVYVHAGPELAVASTKAFINQVAILSVLALQLGRLHRISLAKGKLYVDELKKIPEKITKILKLNEEIKKMAQKYQSFEDFYFLGRGLNYPVALEGALKLKEISYVHAEGLAAGEMKHGPIALIDEKCPVVAIITKDNLYDKMISNVEEIKARNGKILIIANEGDEKVKNLSEDIVYIPKTIETLEPLLNVIPLQLFAYHMAVLRGRDVDRPRNLAKSVTVE